MRENARVAAINDSSRRPVGSLSLSSRIMRRQQRPIFRKYERSSRCASARHVFSSARAHVSAKPRADETPRMHRRMHRGMHQRMHRRRRHALARCGRCLEIRFFLMGPLDNSHLIARFSQRAARGTFLQGFKCLRVYRPLPIIFHTTGISLACIKRCVAMRCQAKECT